MADYNMLPYNAATIEVDATAWAVAGASSAQSAAQQFEQSFSLAITASTSSPIINTPQGTSGVSVAGSTAYTASIYVRPNTTARNVTLNLDWYTSAGTYISTSSASPSAETGGAWTRFTLTASSPSNAAFVSVNWSLSGTATNEIHYLDAAQLEVGSTAHTFQPPGVNASETARVITSSLRW